MEGWIKLYRKIFNNPGYHSEKFCRNMAWIDLLLLANHEPNFFYKRGIRVDVNIGQIGYDMDTLAKRWKWSRNKIERWFRELEKDKQIVRQKNNVTTLITIVNYSTYQGNGNTEGKAKGKANRKAEGKANGNKQECKEGIRILYSDFYDSEIEKSQNDSNYIRVVKILFGENNLCIPLDSVLKMPIQLSYDQFKKIWYLKEKYKISITEILESMENWNDLKKRKTVYSTFLTFAKKRNPEITLK